MTDTQASKVATDEMLSMLPPDKRRQLLVDNDGERLSINFAGKNGKVDRNQGGLSMSMAGDDFRSRHASLVDFISDEGLWGNNQMLGLATGLLDKRAAYYSYDSIAKRGQQAFESAAANSQARYNHINRDRIAQQQNSVMQSRQLNILNNQQYVRDQVSFVSELKNSALQRVEVTAEGSASFGTGIKVSTDTNIGLNSRSATIENTKGVGLMASATVGAKLFASEKGVSGLFNSINFSLGAGVAAGFSIAWDYNGNWEVSTKVGFGAGLEVNSAIGYKYTGF